MKENFLEIRDSKIAGKGVYTTKDIKKGQKVCVLDGEEIDIFEMMRRVDEEESEEGSDPLFIGDDMYIDLYELPRSINHSCDPNCYVSGKNELIAIRDIKAKEEITYDYSTTMNDNVEIIGEDCLWSCKCNCGAKKCRGIITQFRMLPKKVQKYYLDNHLVPDYIQRAFN